MRVSKEAWLYTHPSIVSRMLIRRSAPQPATMRTPMGGTSFVCQLRVSQGASREAVGTKEGKRASGGRKGRLLRMVMRMMRMALIILPGLLPAAAV